MISRFVSGYLNSARRGKSCCNRLFALTGLLAALAAPAAGAFQIEEGSGTIAFSSTHTSVVLSTTGGELLEVGYRASAEAAWDRHALSITGRRRSLAGSSDTSAVAPIIRWVELEGQLLIKCEIQQDDLFWNFWYALDNGSRVIEAARFAYGDNTSLSLTGVGVVVDAPGYTATTTPVAYEALGGSYTGNYTDFAQAGKGVRLYVSNMADQTMATAGSETIIWCRSTSTNWGSKIDYRRMALVPFQSGDSLDAHNGYARLKVFDHDLTNVELAGSWVMRYRNRNGNIRDWFNAANYDNGFIPATGSSYVSRTGFWRDDWTTGALLRGVKMTYDVTADPFYFMRFIDLLDYQITRTEVRLKVQWGINNAWNENYPMGRIEAAMDAYDLAGWEFYKDVAVNSCDWYFSNEAFVAGAGHLETGSIARNYSDMAYNFEGAYRADAHNNKRWHTFLNDYYAHLEKVTWNNTSGLYGHLLGSGINYHWGRGHGWWVETFTNIMDFYDRPDKPTIRAHYETAVANLIKYQNGIWHKQIDAPSTFLDASAGSMIAAGLAISFLRGELGVEALESALTAIATLTNSYLQKDGTLIGTDRGSVSNDPFPYTQEGYVNFARSLGIREIVKLADRAVLSTTFAEGVMITDAAGGTVTDANGDVITVDGVVVIDEYPADKRFLRLLGTQPRNVSLHGFEADRIYTVTDLGLTAGSSQTTAATATAAGVLDLALALTGEHELSLYPRVPGTIWTTHPINPDGYMWLEGLGYIYDGNWPYVHMSYAGWTYVAPGSTDDSLWFYDYTAAGWRWTNSFWGGWYYDAATQAWGQYLQPIVGWPPTPVDITPASL